MTADASEIHQPASASHVASLVTALDQIASDALVDAGVIGWGSPIPAFGNPSRSTVATLGINPSNREFMDEHGCELVGPNRRFHTLSSLGIERWTDADSRHLELILKSLGNYFSHNPYDGWFKRLDQVMSGIGNSFYGTSPNACHLDLIPFATTQKWTQLASSQRARLLHSSGDTFGHLVRDSPIETLILNGRTVVSSFEAIAGVKLQRRVIPGWHLSRNSTPGVPGLGFRGIVTRIGGVSLEKELVVLGFNHNLQSSFGVTTVVLRNIRNWLTRNARHQHVQ
jgi:hypothetical protein